MYQGIEVIAEVKTQSPFGYQSSQSWEELFELANQVGDTISIHTDPRWGGSFELLEKARKLTRKPILAKGLHARDEEVKRAVDLGANWVLVVGRLPKMNLNRCWIEPVSLFELPRIPKEQRVVWNSRHLGTGQVKKETVEEARKLFPGWLCQASNIKTVSDIKPGVSAVLVGTYLAEFADSLNINNEIRG